MGDGWYSVLLIVGSEEEMNGLVLNYVAPLMEKLDEEGEEYLFHFFRYSARSSDPGPFLRLRVRGPPPLRGVAESFEEEWAEKLQVSVQPEAYSVKSELYEGSAFKSEEDIEKAWRIYELGSRLAIAAARNSFSIDRLREDNHAIILKLNHLFLNSLGLNTVDERNTHLLGVLERSLALLSRGGELTSSQIWAQYEMELGQIRQKLVEISGIVNNALSD